MPNSNSQMHQNAEPKVQSSDGWRRQGYPKLAKVFGRNQEHAIFRRFGPLAMLNLMSLQAEILDLEKELENITEQDDKTNDPDVSLYSRSFYHLRCSQPPNHLQRELLETTRQKLEQYCKT